MLVTTYAIAAQVLKPKVIITEFDTYYTQCVKGIVLIIATFIDLDSDYITTEYFFNNEY